MRWWELLRILGDCPIKIYKQSLPEMELLGIQEFYGVSDAISEGCLLFCRYSQLTGIQISRDMGCCLFLFLDSEPIDAAQWVAFSNVAATSDEALFQQCVKRICSSFRAYQKLESAHRTLIDLIASNQPLTTLANTIGTAYGHYIDIIDNSLNILAISENVAPPAENLLEDHQRRYVKPHVVQYLRTTGNLEKMQSSRLPVLVEDEPRNTYAYSVPISAGAALNLGYLCVFVTKGEALSPIQLYYLPKTAKLLSLEMQKSRSSSFSKSTYFTHLLSDMLQGRSTADSTFEARFAAFNYDLRRWKNIIVLHIGPMLPQSTDLHVLSQTLQAVFSNSVYMIQDNYIVFLVSRSHFPMLPPELLTEWRAYVRSNKLCVGISSTFEHVHNAVVYLEQAKSALALGERFHPGESLHLYDHLRLIAIVDQLAGRDDLHFYCFPPLLHLIEADRSESSGALVQTLRCYMKNGYSAADTCKELFIHRNTLYYRIDKIRDIMGCDFLSPEHAAQISLTFVILQYLDGTHRFPAAEQE